MTDMRTVFFPNLPAATPLDDRTSCFRHSWRRKERARNPLAVRGHLGTSLPARLGGLGLGLALHLIPHGGERQMIHGPLGMIAERRSLCGVVFVLGARRDYKGVGKLMHASTSVML